MKTFSFGAEFQRALLRLLMTDETFCHKAMQYVESGFFTTRPFGWIFSVMQKYYTEYSCRISEMPLREAARQEPGYLMEVEAVIALGFIKEADYIKTELLEFVRRNIFARAHEESAKMYNDHQYVKAYDLTCKATDRMRQITFEEPDRSWIFDELEERMIKRYQHQQDPTDGVYSTGIDVVDDALDGGPKRGEVHLVLAPPKTGKTIWLLNQAFVTTRVSRKPSIIFNLEGPTALIEDRIDSCFSTELYTAVRRGDIHPILYKELVEEYRQLRGLLVLRTLNEWNVNILHIDAELQELKSEGFEPELIVIDYQDIMRSRATGNNSETQHQTDAMKDVKRLANRGYLIWTACQTQRLKEGDDEREYLIKASSIADAYGKIRIVDGYGSLNATREEKLRGECRYYLENYRAGPVGKVFRLYNQNDRMRVAVNVKEERLDTTSKKRKPSTEAAI